jgi:hypothetical protein
MHGKRFGHFDERFQADDVHCKDAYATYLGLRILERQDTILKMLCNVLLLALPHQRPGMYWQPRIFESRLAQQGGTGGTMGSLSLLYLTFS